MGLRTRLKSRVKRALGGGEGGVSAAAPPAPAAAPAAAAAPPAPVAAAPPVPAASAHAAGSSGTPDEEAQQAAKIERARMRARKGVLRHISEHDSGMSMGDAHSYSERRYFIAHRGFSDMMEWWLERDHITYDAGEGVVRVTAHGRAFSDAGQRG